jgi:hypothetical protein
MQAAFQITAATGVALGCAARAALDLTISRIVDHGPTVNSGKTIPFSRRSN